MIFRGLGYVSPLGVLRAYLAQLMIPGLYEVLQHIILTRSFSLRA